MCHNFSCRVSENRSLLVWVNIDEHLRLVSMREDANVAEAFQCICISLQKVNFNKWINNPNKMFTVPPPPTCCLYIGFFPVDERAASLLLQIGYRCWLSFALLCTKQQLRFPTLLEAAGCGAECSPPSIFIVLTGNFNTDLGNKSGLLLDFCWNVNLSTRIKMCRVHL